jgi:hypothetical protein
MLPGGDVLVVLDGRAESERVVGWVGRTRRSGQRVDERDGRGPGQRDDDGHPRIREREIAARIAAVRRLPEPEAQEHLERPEEHQGHESVERQVSESAG